MFEREGVDGPADLAIAGSVGEVEDGLQRLRDAGVTDFAASIYATNSEEGAATREILQKING